MRWNITENNRQSEQFLKSWALVVPVIKNSEISFQMVKLTLFVHIYSKSQKQARKKHKGRHSSSLKVCLNEKFRGALPLEKEVGTCKAFKLPTVVGG